MSALKLKPGAATMSGIPAHLVNPVRVALDGDDAGAHQLAFNALSPAAWHVARNELPQALARMRRARSHIMAFMESAKQADSVGAQQ